ncbi:MAG: S-layer homology domain-containing protein, partial [Eubacteriales bacterium]
AKRSVANGALYDGTLIQQWSDLYSEGITTFGETRGFDVVTVAEPAAYEAIAAVCGEWMDYEDCLEYLAGLTSAFTGAAGAHVILSNASEDSTAAVNALLKSGKKVGMVTDETSAYYGDFVCSYDAWLTVADEYILTGTGIAADAIPDAKVITKAPVVYITGESSGDSTSGFVKTAQVTNTNWNYDRIAMDLLNFTVTSDLSEADVILGASALSEDAAAAVKSGTPYIGYGSRGGKADVLFGESLVRESAFGMDCLAYVTYPTTTLVNASYVMDGDDVLYGYGVGYYTTIPEGASVLVQMDGSREPTEGFIQAITEEQKAASDAYLGGSIQAIAYNGPDAEGSNVNVVLFANSLTHKVHQRDEYAYISNFIFSNLLGSSYVDCAMGDACVISKFVDVDTTAWYHDALDAAVASGMMNGVAADKFNPDGNVTNAMLAAILYKMAGSPEVTGEMPYENVPADAWYSDAVLWAVGEGLLGEDFDADANVKSQTLVSILKQSVSADSISIVLTDGAYELSAGSDVTRAEAAAILAGIVE